MNRLHDRIRLAALPDQTTATIPDFTGYRIRAMTRLLSPLHNDSSHHSTCLIHNDLLSRTLDPIMGTFLDTL